MYIKDTISYLLRREKRVDLTAVSEKISRQYDVCRTKIILDMIWCAMRYGAMWTEYEDLSFCERTNKNRNTFITTFYNFKLYKRLNQEKYLSQFRNKISFLTVFSDYVKRKWLDTRNSSDEEITAFLKRHKNVVAKGIAGDSGKEIEVFAFSEEENWIERIQYIRKNHFDLIEELVTNCEEIKKLNESSLNTLRIVTVRGDDAVSILFSGLRIGGRGSKIDNISQGGRVCRVNTKTGQIDSQFYGKASSFGSCATEENDPNVIGYQIPRWNEVIETVKQAANKIPEVRIVAWDVAITPEGVELIEGNESYGSVIMQLFYSPNEPGLKPILSKILEKI